MRPLSRSLSSLGDGKGGDRARSNDEPEVPAKKKKKRKTNEQSFYVHFKWPDLGPPTGGCPNQIVLVGWGFLPRTAYII